MSNINAQAQRG